MNDSIRKYQVLLESVPCNLCGSNDFVIIYPPRYEHAKPEEILNTFRSSGDEVLLDQLVQCKHCGLQYLNPRLKSDVVLEGYGAGTDETFVSQVAGREKTFANSLKYIEKFKPQRGHLLDVGTAGGSFLSEAKKAGWDVAGCEPNRWLCDWGNKHYGLNIKPGTIFDMKLPSASFDVVTLWDVLEHTPDPKAVLVECARVLKKGGLLVVNYPDIHSSIARLMGRRWVFLLSVHLYYFTSNTLDRMLKEIGFASVARRKHWQTLEFGYILFRMETYLGGLARLIGRLAKTLRVSRWQLPYWMGQVLVIAEKN